MLVSTGRIETGKAFLFNGYSSSFGYMMGSPNHAEPLFGVVTNGDGFLFVKLVKSPQPTYALSDDFSLFNQAHNELYYVLKIFKRIGQQVYPNLYQIRFQKPLIKTGIP
jgi:hypothetical protein